jgi:hypothetical protein
MDSAALREASLDRIADAALPLMARLLELHRTPPHHEERTP